MGGGVVFAGGQVLAAASPLVASVDTRGRLLMAAADWSRLASLVDAMDVALRLYSAPTERDPEWDATPGDTVTWTTIRGPDESWAQSMVGPGGHGEDRRREQDVPRDRLVPVGLRASARHGTRRGRLLMAAVDWRPIISYAVDHSPYTDAVLNAPVTSLCPNGDNDHEMRCSMCGTNQVEWPTCRAHELERIACDQCPTIGKLLDFAAERW